MLFQIHRAPGEPDSASQGTDFDVLAGTIVGAHGVQGALKIKIATDTALSLIEPGASGTKSAFPVWIGNAPHLADAGVDTDLPGGLFNVKQVKELQPDSRVRLLKLQGVTDRNQAEALVGLPVYAPKERRADLEDGEFFTDDLIGLKVTSAGGRNFGTVTAVLQHPANDVYETDLGALIPAVKAVVEKIDLKAKTITVVDMPGLLPEEAEEVPEDESP